MCAGWAHMNQGPAWGCMHVQQYTWQEQQQQVLIQLGAYMVWTTTLQTPQYKTKVQGEGNLSLAVETGENECVDMMIRDPKMVRKCRSSKRKVHRDSVTKFQKKRRQRSVRYTRNVSENDDDKRRNEIWGQYTVVQSKGELSVLFGSGGNKKHKYSYNNRMKCKMLAKRKANRPEIIPKKLTLWCTNHVKRVWWNVPEKATQLGRVLKMQNLKMSQMV